MAGLNIVHIPFKGGGPAMIDVIAGNTQMCVGSLLQSAPRKSAPNACGSSAPVVRSDSHAARRPTIAESASPGTRLTMVGTRRTHRYTAGNHRQAGEGDDGRSAVGRNEKAARCQGASPPTRARPSRPVHQDRDEQMGAKPRASRRVRFPTRGSIRAHPRSGHDGAHAPLAYDAGCFLTGFRCSMLYGSKLLQLRGLSRPPRCWPRCQRRGDQGADRQVRVGLHQAGVQGRHRQEGQGRPARPRDRPARPRWPRRSGSTSPSTRSAT